MGMDKKDYIKIRIDPIMKEQFKVMAKRNNSDMSKLLVKYIELELEKDAKQQVYELEHKKNIEIRAARTENLIGMLKLKLKEKKICTAKSFFSYFKR